MIKRGTLVHSEKPFIHALATNLRLSRCDHCYSEYELFKCAACHYAKYCDRDCQKAAWRDHKKECSCFKKLPPGRELPNAARILARIIFKLKRGGGNEQGWYDKNKFRMFKDLMSHYSDIKSDSKRIEHAQCLFNVLRDFMGEDELPNFTEFLGIYGRMIVNSFNILDGEMSELGTGIYLGASTIDHSCEPNAVATFCGTVLNIRTVQDIHDFKWSKLRISYIETVKPRIDRNLDLWPRYYFECDCPRCDTKSEWASLEDSVICQQCESLVYVKQDNCSCSKCGWVPADDFIIKYNDIVSFTKHQHEVMRNVAYLDVCKLCLEKQSGLFHPDNVLHVRTLDLAFEASIQLQKWEDSLDFGPKLIPGFEKYYGTHHPILGLHYLKFGKILMFKDACDKALDYLEKAQTILRVTHGEDHPLYRTVLSSLLLQAKTLVYNS